MERDFHGALLDWVEAVIQSAGTRTCKGTHPLVTWVTTPSQTGVNLSQKAMQAVATQLQR